MKEKERLARLRRRLVARRDAIFYAHRRTEEARRTLLEPEVEFEETSQKESMADTLASVDTQEERELEAINRALARMEAGDYLVCESCGGRISLRRLEAIPWTTECVRCAKREETGPAAAEEPGPSSRRPAGLPGNEEIERIFDELREDGAVDTEELRIAVHGKSVHLEGFLPTEAQRGRLREIVEDHIGLADVVDEIAISPLSWERSDRTPGEKTVEDVAEELAPEEEDLGPGAFESRRTGTPLSPSDTLEPEEA